MKESAVFVRSSGISTRMCCLQFRCMYLRHPAFGRWRQSELVLFSERSSFSMFFPFSFVYGLFASVFGCSIKGFVVYLKSDRIGLFRQSGRFSVCCSCTQLWKFCYMWIEICFQRRTNRFFPLSYRMVAFGILISRSCALFLRVYQMIIWNSVFSISLIRRSFLLILLPEDIQRRVFIRLK